MSIPFPTTNLEPAGAQAPEDRTRQLFEEAPVAYHEIDTGGVIRGVNQAECELLGYARESLLGRPIWEFIAPEQQSIAREAITRKIAGELPVAVVTREYRRADGSYIWLEIHERLMKNSAGETVGIRSALFDVTERRNFDTRIQRQHQWMARVLRSIGSAVITADALGAIDFMNPAAEALTGWMEPDARGLALETVCVLKHESGQRVDLMSCLMSEALISNRSRRFEIVDRGGLSHGVQWNIAPILGGDVITGMVMVIEKREA